MIVPVYLYVSVLDIFCVLISSILQPSPPGSVPHSPQEAYLYRLPQLVPLHFSFQLG